jgi:hypothetical protein
MAESADHVSCQEVTELVNDYLEGELPADRVELFEQHVNYCAGCEWYVGQLRITVQRVGRIGEEDAPPAVRERLLDAFRGWKRP